MIPNLLYMSPSDHESNNIWDRYMYLPLKTSLWQLSTSLWHSKVRPSQIIFTSVNSFSCANIFPSFSGNFSIFGNFFILSSTLKPTVKPISFTSSLTGHSAHDATSAKNSVKKTVKSSSYPKIKKEGGFFREGASDFH